jgi:DNA-binding LacI/PurR family transcriptional regulator
LVAPTGKYRDIVTAIRDQLSSGVYRDGDRIPSENQLAIRFGVSRPTAARALRELEGAGLVVRRPGSGTYCRRPELERERTAKIFGLLVPGLGATEIFDPICTEITRVCQEEHSNVLWGDPTRPGAANRPDDDVGEVDRLSRFYLERRVDGVFFAPLEASVEREPENVRIAKELSDAGVAVVLLDRDLLDFPGRSDLDLVGIDNFQAGSQLAEHLLRAGHRRIVFLARAHHPSTTDLRAAGCREALRRAGVEIDWAFHHSGDPSDEGFVGDLMKRMRPDAIVCSNDLTAALLIVALAHLGSQVPRDVAVVGFDDVKYSTLLSVGLTTMRQPYHGLARVAVRAMNDRMSEPDLDARQLLLSAELVVRQSCGSRGASN